MVNQKLINYIKTEEAQGYTPQQLRTSLIQQGYNAKDVDDAIRYANARNIYPPNQTQAQQQGAPEKLGFFKKIILVIKDPKKFYSHVKSEPGIKKAFIFYILFIALTFVLSMIVSILFSIISNPLFGILSIIASLVALIMVPVLLILIIIVIFIMVGIYHLLVKLVGGKNPFSATFKAVVYASVPGTLSSILRGVPQLQSYAIYIYLFGIVWGVLVLTIGVAKLQDISNAKALIVAIVPTLVVIGLLLLALNIFLEDPFAFLTAAETVSLGEGIPLAFPK